MRRLLLVALAILLTAGIASADSVPQAADPQLLPTVWTQTVYNGSGANITSAQVVRWDIGASTTDMAMWIEETDGAADPRTAGVVPYGRDCDNATVCEIIVKGPAIVYDGGNTTGAGTICEADASGQPVDETLGANDDESALGWTIDANASTAANTNLDVNYAVIFVQPTLSTD